MRQQRYLNKHSAQAKADWKQLKRSPHMNTIHLNEKDNQGNLLQSHTLAKRPTKPGKKAQVLICILI